MNSRSRIRAVLRSDSFRKWAIRIGVALLVFEVIYVVGANIFLRTDLLPQLINKKPEKTHIAWDSVVTYLPGFATVKGFTLCSQTKKTNGRLFIKYGIVAAGVALDEGKGKIHLAKPRKWFEEQQNPQRESAEQATDDERQNVAPDGGGSAS